MKRIITLVLVLAMIIIPIALCSCNNRETDNNTVTTFTESKEIIIVENGACNFNVIYPAGSFGPIFRVAGELCNGINNRYGLSVEPSTDETEATAKEILIGDTNRPESETAKSMLDNKDYIIAVINGKLVFYSKVNSGYDTLISIFFERFAGEKLVVPSDYAYAFYINGIQNNDTENTGETISFQNGTKLKLDQNIKLVDSGSYGMGVVLQYNEAYYGRIIYSYGNGASVLISDDEGDTFKVIKGMSDTTKWYGLTFHHAGMSSMFELPVDMGDFPKGTVFECGTSMTGPYGEENIDNGTKSTIHIFYSLDAGETFTLLGYMDMERNLRLGVWEPYMVYEESTGRVYCFYSDDSDPAHDQKLVYKYSTDMIHWVGVDGTVDITEYKTLKEKEYPDPFEAVACASVAARPGMPILTKMGNGEWYMVYEQYGGFTGEIRAKKTTQLDNWDPVNDYGKMIKTVDGRTLVQAPYCAWTPAGGPNGMLFVSARNLSAGESLSINKCDIFVSFDYGEHFTSFENPFDGNIRLSNGYSLRHPVILFSPDGKTMYYFNQPANSKGTANELRLARYRITEE